MFSDTADAGSGEGKARGRRVDMCQSGWRRKGFGQCRSRTPMP